MSLGNTPTPFSPLPPFFSIMPGDTVEYKAIKQLYPEIIAAVSPLIDDILDRAWAKGLTHRSALSTGMSPAVGAEDKARTFVSAILPRINCDPQAFDLFLGVLNEFTPLKFFVKKLRDKVGELNGRKPEAKKLPELDSAGQFDDSGVVQDGNTEENLDYLSSGACGTGDSAFQPPPLPVDAPMLLPKEHSLQTDLSDTAILPFSQSETGVAPEEQFEVTTIAEGIAEEPGGSQSNITSNDDGDNVTSMEESSPQAPAELVTPSDGHLDAIDSHVKATRIELQQKENTISQQQKTIQAKEVARQLAETQKELMEVEIQKKDLEITKIKKEVETLNSELEAKDEEVRKYRYKIAALEKENQSVQDLRHRIHELQMQLSEMKDTNEGIKSEYEAEIQKLKQNLKDENAKVKERDGQLLDLRTKAIERREEIVTLKENIMELKEREHVLEHEKSETENKLKEEELKNEKLEHENTKRVFEQHRSDSIPKDEHEDELKRVESELQEKLEHQQQNSISREEHDAATIRNLEEQIECLRCEQKPSSAEDSTITFDASSS